GTWTTRSRVPAGRSAEWFCNSSGRGLQSAWSSGRLCRSSERPMSSDGSVTHWIGQLQAGNPATAQPLWERYFQQLVRLARKKLQGSPRRAADEEDVALSAFDSFCRAAEAHRFPNLADRDDLWRLLVVLTARKALHQSRDECRLKRGGGHVLDENALG